MLSKIILSTRIAKAMSSLTQFMCYCVKLDLYPENLVHSRFLMSNRGAKGLNKSSMFDL